MLLQNNTNIFCQLERDLLKLISDLIGNFLVSFLSPYILIKQFPVADLKQMSLLCLKCLFYSNVLVFPMLNLRKNVLIEFLERNFLVFLSTYKTAPEPVHSEKMVTAKKENIWTRLQQKRKSWVYRKTL